MKRVNQVNINTAKNFDCLFGKELLTGNMRDAPNRLNALMRDVKERMSVIEIGCGNSTLLTTIKAKFPKSSVYGFDFSTIVISWMRRNNPSIKWTVGNCLAIKYYANVFDYVIAGELLEHMQRPSELISEMVT